MADRGYLKKIIVLISIAYSINTYSIELAYDGSYIISYNGNYTYNKKNENMREKALREYYLKKKELEYLKLSIQREMLKESPDVKKMKILEERFFYIESNINNRIIEYKGEVEYNKLVDNHKN